jgi:parallel beta-helix repeat protein
MQKRVVSGTIMPLLAAILLFSFFLGVNATDEWVPYVPESSHVELCYHTKNNTSCIDVLIEFANSGYNVSDWGTPSIVENNVSAKTEIWKWTGMVFPIVTVYSHTYNLGKLPKGEYSFTFEVWESPVKKMAFRVPIIVPDDYSTIQEAINHANEEDTIFVKNGIYYENVVVNKTVALVGGGPNDTIIDGSRNGIVVSLEANNCNVSCFTIQNSGNSDWDCGVHVHSSGNNLRNNIVTSNKNGIMINWNCDNNILANNSVNANGVYGIHLGYSNNSILNGNTVTNNYDGIIMEFCSNATLRNNTISGNVWNFGVGGEELPYFIHDIDTSNKVEGKPIQYLINAENIVIDSTWDVGYLCVVNSTNVTVKDLTLNPSSWYGVQFAYATNSAIENVTISETSYAIEFVHSFNNTIMNNRISNRNGIRLWHSNDNTIIRNNISGNDMAVLLFYSSNNTLMNNNINNNWRGIFICSSNNKIYHNSFIDNVVQVFTDEKAYTNIWDNGYPSGGNYWSDYTGVDVKSGPNQDQPGSDGIGDTSYNITANNADRYPLMAPINTFYTDIWNGTLYNVDVSSNSTVSKFQLHMAEKKLSFNVTGESDAGFCRLTIPNTIIYTIWQNNYGVVLNGEPIEFKNWTDIENTYIYFTYRHSEQQVITTHEFSSTIIPLSAMLLITIVVTIGKKKPLKKTNI